MSSSVVQSQKHMRRLESRKSHSWWWDSHISPKNSKWLAENLEEMDRSVKRMLKLIEEDGDSFAKKAEMYYQKRPELVSLVEEFYRMYRSLAERYDHVTGELRKNIPSDLQSQGSSVSDIVSELPSMWPSPGPDQKQGRRKSGPRAAGFDFFLGYGGSSKEGDESSTLTDSETESDDSSVNNFSVISGNSGDQALTRKIIELEIELREMKEKVSGDGSFRGMRNDDSEHLLARIEEYEQEVKVANERARLSQEEVTRLSDELQKYKLLEFNDGLLQSDTAASAGNNAKLSSEIDLEMDQNRDAETLEYNRKIQALKEEVRITNERLKESEKEIASLKHQLESNGPSEKESKLMEQLALAQKDVHTWKTKLNAEKREVSKLQERVSRLKHSLTDRDHEIRDLKTAVSDAEEKIFPEKAQIKTEISRLLEERTSLEEQLKEMESHGRCLEDEIRIIRAEKAETEERLNSEIAKLKADVFARDSHIENLYRTVDSLTSERDNLSHNIMTLKTEVVTKDNQIDQMEKHLQELHMEHAGLIAGAEMASKVVEELRSRIRELEEEVERQRVLILEGGEEKREAIRQLCFSLEHYRDGYQMLRQAFMGHKRPPLLAT